MQHIWTLWRDTFRSEGSCPPFIWLFTNQLHRYLNTPAGGSVWQTQLKTCTKTQNVHFSIILHQYIWTSFCEWTFATTSRQTHRDLQWSRISSVCSWDVKIHNGSCSCIVSCRTVRPKTLWPNWGRPDACWLLGWRPNDSKVEGTHEVHLHTYIHTWTQTHVNPTQETPAGVPQRPRFHITRTIQKNKMQFLMKSNCHNFHRQHWNKMCWKKKKTS